MAAAMENYKLFTPLQLADGLKLKNHIVYGPTIRARSDPVSHVPLERNMQYYEQRASAGLVITEGTSRASGALAHGPPVALVLPPDQRGRVGLGHAVRRRPHAQRPRRARGLREGAPEEIPGVVVMFRQSAVRAKRAGFDGLELLANNGYLMDQFLQSSTNQRTDKYGGSFESRYRFLHEIVEALKTVFPASRVAVRLSPNGVFGGMDSDGNTEMFTYAFERLSEHGLAYLAILDGFGFGRYPTMTRPLTVFDTKKACKGFVMANNSYSRSTAEGTVSSGAADLVSFVCLYLPNPDLVEHFQNDWPLNPVIDAEYFWDTSKGDECYHTFKPYQPTNGKTEQKN
ncbi:12-oxophytodienoate reductase [Phytophthora cinnamomi]|uniref:12-oxophytodienoate reductase n=1 Tax=Phytophthora cinnamomi TaxID=4785 RepID=UPI00355A16AF|nr:12-oxophytodienoate reductase [Phytophthora cinnamomi]